MAGAPDPDFLVSLIEAVNFMRLSLEKAAPAVLAGAEYRKSGYLAFFARCGKSTALSR
jgi:hypothetical protein